MNLNKFDIVLVDFPFSDLSEIKKRPALVLKSLEGDNVLLCQITTKRRKIQKYEIPLKRNSCQGNIMFDSFIYLDMIFTLHKKLIHRKIGSVTDKNVKDLLEEKYKETII